MDEPQVCPRPGCGGRLRKQKLESSISRKLGKDFWLSCVRCFAGYVVAVDGKLRLVLEGFRMRAINRDGRRVEKVVADA